MGTVTPASFDEWWCSCVTGTQSGIEEGIWDGDVVCADVDGGATAAGCDAAPYQSRTCPRARFSSDMEITQSISFGRLHGRGSQAVPHSVQDGITDLRIDRHGSMAGNPFHGAATAVLCAAFDVLLHLALSRDFDFDRDLALYPSMVAALSHGVEGPSVDSDLLRHVANRSGCRVHRWAHAYSLTQLRAWLCHHAALLAAGGRVRLLCWCIDGHTSCGACHGQGLAGALLWIASNYLAQLTTKWPVRICHVSMLLLLIQLLSPLAHGPYCPLLPSGSCMVIPQAG